jgi:hypothetical protein
MQKGKKGFYHRIPEMLHRDDEVVAFFKEWDKIHTKRRSGRTNAQTAVRASTGHRSRYIEMGELLIFVALDLFGVDPKQFQVMVKQNACTGATLPIDEGDILPGEIFQ